MKINFEIDQKAQVIPILAISLLVIVMMVALVLDGSDIMVNRRSAQNAADAGALAGARELCLKHGEQAAIDAATLYVQENNAVLVQTSKCGWKPDNCAGKRYQRFIFCQSIQPEFT